jgi:class 3 adenylate cyclase
MPSVGSSVWRREPGPAGGRLEICLVRADVACHQDLHANLSEQDVKCLKDTVKGAFLTIAEHWGGKLFSSDGDGSAFAFPGGGDDSFNGCCSSAIQMLEMVPALNQDFRPSPDLDGAVEVRICCDAGTVTPGPGLSGAAGDFVNKLMQYRRQAGAADGVTITDRVYGRLTDELKARFVRRQYSAELEADLYSTPPLQGDAEPQDSPGASLAAAPVRGEPSQPRSGTPSREAGPPIGARLRGLAGRAAPWTKVGGALLGWLLAVLLVVHALTRPGAPAPAPATSPDEPAHADEWPAWRKHVQEKLANAQVSEDDLAEALRTRPNDVRLQLELRQVEESLVEALRGRPARPAGPPAAMLRHDEAVADVLLAYGGVRFTLRRRFGIDKDFLGTGLSRPGGERGYSTASVHEYLIRNYRDTHEAVWTWQLHPVAPNLPKPIRQILAGDGDQKLGRIAPAFDRAGTFDESVTGLVLPRIKARDPILPPVIRFAKFPATSYKHTVGRPDAVRVFASNLAEVWDLPLQEAARLSGYTLGATSPEGDTFFIWVFVPTQQSEVVPATWGRVLDNLPAWLKEGEG